MLNILIKVTKAVRRLGWKETAKRTYSILFTKVSGKILSKYNQKALIKVLENTPFPVMIFPPYIDFNIPLYQRPQHFASCFSAYFTYLFYTTNNIDRIHRVTKIKKNLYLIPHDQYQTALNVRTKEKKILFLYSHPAECWDEVLVEQFLADNNMVIYDYLDDLNNEIFGSVSEKAIRRHRYALKNKKIILLVTASRLLEDAKKYRPCLSNTHLIPNAVDPAHFQRKKNVVGCLSFGNDKKIIGYFGALAAWVDYELIDKLASANPNYHLLLLGYVYDDKFYTTGLDKRTNITVIGPIPYSVLPDYAHYFDVSIIPFLINETTLATSPIKLFEYMALGKPIVSTALPECSKYKSALIAQTHDDFLRIVEEALTIDKSSEYFTVLQNEAVENTWQQRTQIVKRVIYEHLNAM